VAENLHVLLGIRCEPAMIRAGIRASALLDALSADFGE
jgi:hypothetical protein